MEDEDELFTICPVGEDTGEPEKATVWDTELDERVFTADTEAEAKAFVAAIEKYNQVRDGAVNALRDGMKRGTVVLIVTTTKDNRHPEIKAFPGDGKAATEYGREKWGVGRPLAGGTYMSLELDLATLDISPISWS